MVLAYTECLGIQAKPLTAVAYALLLSSTQSACFALVAFLHCTFVGLKMRNILLLKLGVEADGAWLTVCG